MSWPPSWLRDDRMDDALYAAALACGFETCSRARLSEDASAPRDITACSFGRRQGLVRLPAPERRAKSLPLELRSEASATASKRKSEPPKKYWLAFTTYSCNDRWGCVFTKRTQLLQCSIRHPLAVTSRAGCSDRPALDGWWTPSASWMRAVCGGVGRSLIWTDCSSRRNTPARMIRARTTTASRGIPAAAVTNAHTHATTTAYRP